MSLIDTKARARFESRVERRGPDECWPWHGSKASKDGRGTISINGKNMVAPRLSWALANGKMPPADMLVCHSCDNPNCVNPAHLWLGTVSDNARDASAKKRLYMQRYPEMSFFAQPENFKLKAKGSRHGSSKLSEADVSLIKQGLADGETILCLSERFGVSTTSIFRIKNGRNWGHVEPAN